MSDMIKSTSRLSFLLLIITSCVGFLLGKLSPELFVPIVMAGVGAYFVSKGKEIPANPNLPQDVKTPPTQ